MHVYINACSITKFYLFFWFSRTYSMSIKVSFHYISDSFRMGAVNFFDWKRWRKYKKIYEAEIHRKRCVHSLDICHHVRTCFGGKVRIEDPLTRILEWGNISITNVDNLLQKMWKFNFYYTILGTWPLLKESSN
jgi:hypothetical protein